MAEGYDGAIGSRFSSESALVRYPFFQIVCNRGYHLLLNLLLRLDHLVTQLRFPGRALAGFHGRNIGRFRLRGSFVGPPALIAPDGTCAGGGGDGEFAGSGIAPCLKDKLR